MTIVVEVTAYSKFLLFLGIAFWASGYLVLGLYGADSEKNLKFLKWYGLLGYSCVGAAGLSVLTFTYLI